MEKLDIKTPHGRDITLDWDMGRVHAASEGLRFQVWRTATGFTSKYPVGEAGGRVIDILFAEDQQAVIGGWLDGIAAEVRQHVVIVERLADGGIGQASSADGRFSWFWMSPGYIHDREVSRAIYQGAYMGQAIGESDPVPPDVLAAAHLFMAAVSQEDESGKAQKRLDAAKSAPVINPRYAGMTGTELAKAEREYDKQHNEGGEGYNPYRDDLYVTS